MPGSTAVYTSKDEPGLIYDVLAVSPQSLDGKRAEWEKVAKVWYRIVDYIMDPATQDDAVAIMAARVGLSAEEYKPFLQGTKILTLAEAKPFFTKADGFASLHGSSKIADDFNVKYEVYKEPQDVDSYIDGSITLGLK